MDSMKGQLIVAGADLFDPNFRRTVVLVTEHGDEGALGLVLNRPAEVTVGEAVPGLTPLVDETAHVFVGGPVDQRSVLVLAEFDDPDECAATVFGDVGFVRVVADPLREDVFGEHDDELWTDVVKRQGGGYFNLLATMPDDPSLN